MNGPNFFIVGAPKCGTTALSEYLRGHPQVFMATPKEPHYFAHDFPLYKRQVPDLNAYLKLFYGALASQSARGEASVWYLYSQSAIPAIHAFNPTARLIVLLRNPLDVVHSLHAQLVWTLDEDVTDFATAWSLQGRRARGEAVPSRCREPAFLQYGAAARLGQQLARALQVFPREQIKVLFLEDLQQSAAAVYAEVLAFLDLLHDGRSAFPRINESKRHRSALAATMLQRPPTALVGPYRRLKQTLRFKGIGLQRKLLNLNDEIVARVPLSTALRGELLRYFADDIAQLSDLTGRDLRSWSSDSAGDSAKSRAIDA